ncbi:kinase-like domain-containing protein [Annulohypoxylon moriforme]|nr:kinase-like domain-containing protein [Annulohypoxylon moriforme]
MSDRNHEEIPATSLIALASRIYERVFHKSNENGQVISRMAGSYNDVHIIQLDDDFKLVIRVPVVGWDSDKTETAARALESTVATMRLVAKSTSIPVPQVYDFDTSDDNEIQAPYMCISFVPGTPVSHVWFKDPDDMPLKEFRLNILQSLSKIMAQFSCFSFDQIGSISSEETHSECLGPCYDWELNEEGTLQVVSSGPFDTISEYLEHHFKKDEVDAHRKGASEIVKLVMPIALPDDSSEDFVLCPPDFDSQNIMVDSQGNVTGLIDWDLAKTMPRSMGYAKLPVWLSRDWDPIAYAWPGMLDAEDSPKTLKTHRDHYRIYLGEALNWDRDWELAFNSHLTEAVWVAVHHPRNRVEICQKLVEEAFSKFDSDEDSTDGQSILFQVGSNCLEEEDWDTLYDSFENFFLSPEM